MTREYNELVGLQVTFSKAVSRYSMTHYYRWQTNGVTTEEGVFRGYDMERHEPIPACLDCLRRAYAPAILNIWQKATEGCFSEYFQFVPAATPVDMRLDGEWTHWAQWM